MDAGFDPVCKRVLNRQAGWITIVSNFADIAEHNLQRDVQFVYSYICHAIRPIRCELDRGATNAGKPVLAIYRSTEVAEIRKHLIDFANYFVICTDCKSTSTELALLRNSSTLLLECNHCNASNVIMHKVSQIIAHTMRRASKPATMEPLHRILESNEEGDHKLPAKRLAFKKFVAHLVSLAKSAGPATDIVKEARQCLPAFKVSQTDLFHALWVAFIECALDVRLAIQANAKELIRASSLIGDHDPSLQFLSCIEFMVVTQPNRVDEVPLMLYVLHEEGLVSDQAILSWYDGSLIPSLPSYATDYVSESKHSRIVAEAKTLCESLIDAFLNKLSDEDDNDEQLSIGTSVESDDDEVYQDYAYPKASMEIQNSPDSIIEIGDFSYVDVANIYKLVVDDQSDEHEWTLLD